MSKMAWFVHYWDEINNRNIRSSEIRTGEDAMQKACSLMEQGYVVSHVAGLCVPKIRFDHIGGEVHREPAVR